MRLKRATINKRWRWLVNKFNELNLTKPATMQECYIKRHKLRALLKRMDNTLLLVPSDIDQPSTDDIKSCWPNMED